MERLYTYLMAQSRVGGTIQIAIGVFVWGLVTATARLLLFGWGSPGSVVSDAALDAAVTALAWFFSLAIIAPNELTSAQFTLLERSWPNILQGKRRSTRSRSKPADIEQMLHPPLRDQAYDIDELAEMLQELEMCFGFWRDIRQRQGSGLGPDGTFRSVRLTNPLVTMAAHYRRMYIEVVASLKSVNSEIERLQASLLNDAGRVLLEATEVRAAALLAEKEYLENWFDDNAYHAMRMQNLGMEADWVEEQAKAIASRQKALWTLCPLDGQPELMIASYTPGPYNKN